MPFEDLTKSRLQDLEIYLLDQEVQALTRDQIARSKASGTGLHFSETARDLRISAREGSPILSLDGQDCCLGMGAR